MGITCFTAPTQCFQVFYMCTFQRCCARVRDVVHVSQQSCTFHRSCPRFTSPLITFVFNCKHTERILISKSFGTRSPEINKYIYITFGIKIQTYHFDPLILGANVDPGPESDAARSACFGQDSWRHRRYSNFCWMKAPPPWNCVDLRDPQNSTQYYTIWQTWWFLMRQWW